MNKKSLIIILLIFITITGSSCGVLRKPLDKSVLLSKHMYDTLEHIREEDWQQSLESLTTVEKAWKRIKPVLQIDIDHDYINEMEDRISVLKAYIEVQDKSNALATIFSMRNIWESIGQM